MRFKQLSHVTCLILIGRNRLTKTHRIHKLEWNIRGITYSTGTISVLNYAVHVAAPKNSKNKGYQQSSAESHNSEIVCPLYWK